MALAIATAFGATPPSLGRYILVLSEPAAAEKALAPASERTAHLQRLTASHTTLKSELARRNLTVTGEVNTVLNAVFVQAAKDREAELRSLPGVAAVIPQRSYHQNLNAAVNLVNAPAAWSALGGIPNAGAGMKIAVIDTGLDQNHPAFKNSPLSIPAGFPKCAGSDCKFTNNKVIVARSYVSLNAAGTQSNPAIDSQPDDYSPRDRVGHGTAVASVAAGQTNTGPSATITGLAPAAYLGNYKIFGSPNVNDSTSDQAIIQAIEDALKDGMNVAVLSLGAPAFYGPLDSGAICGNSAGVSCDPEVPVIENAAKAGLILVFAGGNEAGTAVNSAVSLATVDAPGYSPSAISVAAVQNSHFFAATVSVPGSDAPSNLQQIIADVSDATVYGGALTAPLVDVGGNGLECTAPVSGSLNGSIALILRGTCNFSVKIANAAAGGAAGVIIYDNNSEALFSFSPSLSGNTIPVVFISNSDGRALKTFADAHSNHLVTINPTPVELQSSNGGVVADFSSRGPAIDGSVKPDVAGVGTNMYMAAQAYDPAGALYDPSGYTVADGTSFSTPMLGGAAALVKQKNPGFSVLQVKSALVNTASSKATDASGVARVNEVGSGLLDTNAAITTNVTIVPSSVSFGFLTTGNPSQTHPLTITNTGTSSVSLQLSVVQRDPDSRAKVAVDRSSLSLTAGQSATVNVTLTGSAPSPGSYEGAINITGGAVPLHVPYQYVLGNGTPYDMVILSGDQFNGAVGQDIPDGIISFMLIDRYGVPVPNVPVSFRVSQGTGQLLNADPKTDQYGIATVEPVLGPQANQAFTATAAGISYQFTGTASPLPTIAANGIVNAASSEAKPLAPGSFATIYGSNLNSFGQGGPATALPLPLDIGYMNVSFDVPSANISVPGRLTYVGDNQVNVLIPWELAGQSSAYVKVWSEGINGTLYTLPLATFSPALFAYTDTNGKLSASALDQNQKLISSSNAVARGQVAQLFANGLGPVTNQPPTGEAAPSSPLAQTTTAPTVTIGGQNATVSFSGLAPGFAGLYQLNVVVPTGVAVGYQPVVISIGGVVSNNSVSLNVK